MLNYIKSEFYRITRSPGFYVTGAVFTAIPLLLNFLLFGFLMAIPDYRYSTTSFSYSNLVASPMIFCAAGLVLVYVLYEGHKRSGSLKNIIASGISREKLFMGQLIVTFCAAAAILVLTLAVYILSASLLLPLKGPVTAMDMIRETVAVLPVAVAALIFAMVVVLVFDRASSGILCWICVFMLVPQILYYIGMAVPSVNALAMWLPYNFFSSMAVNQSICEPIWNTPEGFARCMIAGFLGIVIFTAFGLLSIRKKEL